LGERKTGRLAPGRSRSPQVDRLLSFFLQRFVYDPGDLSDQGRIGLIVFFGIFHEYPDTIGATVGQDHESQVVVCHSDSLRRADSATGLMSQDHLFGKSCFQLVQTGLCLRQQGIK